LPEALRNQEVVYIGRSVHLRRRLSEFYRHVHGCPRPHRGGEDIKLLTAPKRVFWVKTADYAAAEDRLLQIFQSRVGAMPFGNRVRSARPKLPPAIYRVLYEDGTVRMLDLNSEIGLKAKK
jgi:hypothetical protein